MRFALFGDIHASLEALNTAIPDARANGCAQFARVRDAAVSDAERANGSSWAGDKNMTGLRRLEYDISTTQEKICKVGLPKRLGH